ncbi:MAG: hypothetical protein NC302_11105 [Bacteroidales bacterium]|nr:hypothetical protein [Bacteroidales bacterium]MCM1416211.1 hypothetical protein [bacterium]MCM1424223.1 hypothetical protein [bacterium]
MLVIESGTIGMQAARSYHSVTKASARSVRGTIADREGWNALFQDQGNTGEKTAEEDGEGQAKLQDLSMHMKNTTGAWMFSTRNDAQEAIRSIKQQCVDFLLELLFPFHRNRGQQTNPLMALASGTNQYTVNGYQMQRYHMEEETTTFSTQGTVKTADGRELSFNLELGMSRRFEEYYQENYVTSVRTFRDPLVINLDSNIAKVSDQKFFFDLDCDGREEEISTLEAGSGFLALDLNGDGEINDGSELFGTKSGDGFKDLARYDADGNGWIDEADPIWEKLLIWTKDEDGKDKLYHLSDLGVGAIGLSRVGTQFSLNSAKTNETNAMIRKTGIFLYESGAVSTIQHVDLATYDSNA